MIVDGPRPAVQWVTGLPGEWLTSADRHVLLLIALDTFNQLPPFTARPSLSELQEWLGDKSKGTVVERIRRLCEPVPGLRPALLEQTPGVGRRRTIYRLRTEHGPNLWSDLPDHNPPAEPVDNPRSGPISPTTTSGPISPTTTETDDRSGPASGPVSGRGDRTTPYPSHSPYPLVPVSDRAREAREQIAAARARRQAEA